MHDAKNKGCNHILPPRLSYDIFPFLDIALAAHATGQFFQ
jgi:hypothetical protein